MATAQQIMKKKTFIKEEMDRQLTKKQSDYLWKKSTGRLADILDQYASLPKGVHTHTDSFIFPAAAIYLTAKEHIPADKAYSIIENSAIANTSAMGEKLAKMMKIPGMSSFFISLWDPISRKMFGESCGFQNVFYPRERVPIGWILLPVLITGISRNLDARSLLRYSVKMTNVPMETCRDCSLSGRALLAKAGNDAIFI